MKAIMGTWMAPYPNDIELRLIRTEPPKTDWLMKRPTAGNNYTPFQRLHTSSFLASKKNELRETWQKNTMP